jgi:lactoylglutathione lyase
MKPAALVIASTLVFGAIGPALSQDDPKSPAEAHRALEPLVGEWDVEVKVFVPGASKPDVSRGTSTRAWAFGGRFLEETLRLESESTGRYEMHITLGHNNWTGRYEWTLVGSQDTATYTYAGAPDPERRSFTGAGSWSFRGPDGKLVDVGMRVVSQWVGDDRDRMSTLVYFTFPGAPESKAVEYGYTRRVSTKLNLGNFSVCLPVKDLAASRAFYEKLGFEQVAGDAAQNWLVLRNGETKIGLFQGMFNRIMLTFNPGWTSQGETLTQFTDIREIQRHLKAKGLTLGSEVEAASGPASLTLTDPDGNPILLDQHVASPPR